VLAIICVVLTAGACVVGGAYTLRSFQAAEIKDVLGKYLVLSFGPERNYAAREQLICREDRSDDGVATDPTPSTSYDRLVDSSLDVNQCLSTFLESVCLLLHQQHT
jgi:hypothetical protein